MRTSPLIYLCCAWLMWNTNTGLAEMLYVSPTGMDGGDCSLASPCKTIAYAIGYAAPGDQINLHSGTYTESGLELNKNVWIVGLEGPLNTIVQAAAVPGLATNRVFRNAPGVTNILSGLTIRHGRAPDGAIGTNGESGGGIQVSGVIYLDQCIVCNNQSGLDGGGSTYVATGSGGGIYVEPNATLFLYGSWIVSNRTTTSITPDGGSGNGGGIANYGTSIIWNSVISYNVTGDGGLAGEGGGIQTYGVDDGFSTDSFLEVVDSRIVNNRTGDSSGSSNFAQGGGLFNGSKECSLIRTDISGNHTGSSATFQAHGGGVALHMYSAPSYRMSFQMISCSIQDNQPEGIFGLSTSPNTTILDSTISSNGSGVFLVDGNLTITNSTISGNQGAAFDLAYYTPDAHLVSIAHCTLTENAGGVMTGTGTANTVRVSHSIVAANTNAGNADCYGSVTSGGYNLFSNTNGCTMTGDMTGNLIVSDPLLGLLRDNGGPTWTHLPLPGSPAVDAGNPTLGTVLATDQRGAPRIQNGTIDIGACETTPEFLISITQMDGLISIGWIASSGTTYQVSKSTHGLFPIWNHAPDGSGSEAQSRQTAAADGALSYSDPNSSTDEKGMYRVERLPCGSACGLGDDAVQVVPEIASTALSDVSVIVAIDDCLDLQTVEISLVDQDGIILTRDAFGRGDGEVTGTQWILPVFSIGVRLDPGDYSIRVRISDSDGCFSSSASASFSVI